MYAANKDKEEYRLRVPLLDILEAEIEYLVVDAAKETIGAWICPTGDVTAQFCSMIEKGQKRIDRAWENYPATIRHTPSNESLLCSIEDKCLQVSLGTSGRFAFS